MRHPPAASPRTAPAPPPPPAPAAAERAERARAERPKARLRCVGRWGGGQDHGITGTRPGRHFCFDRDWTPGPSMGRGRQPGRRPDPRRGIGAGRACPSLWSDSAGSRVLTSLPRCLGRYEPGLVTSPLRMPEMCHVLCRLQTALESACELVQVGKLRQTLAGAGVPTSLPRVMRGTQDSRAPSPQSSTTGLPRADTLTYKGRL